MSPTGTKRAVDDPFTWDDDAVVLNRDDISDFNEENILPESDETLDKIRSWLKPTPFDAENGEYHKHLVSHLAGTGSWLSSTQAYHDWHDSDDHGLLWVKGIPGSGKSVMAASLIKTLSAETVPVLFFFFRQIIDANHAPAAVLRDWLVQILGYSPPLQVKLKEYVEKGRDLESISMSDLWGALRIALAYLPKAYCVVDALDEMDQENDAFLISLADLGRWRPSRVKLLITSRPVASVEMPLRLVPMLHIRLEEREVDFDIATYVQHRLRESKVPSSQHELIEKAVPGRASGLFLYAKLAMDAFTEEGTDVREVLERLPMDLNVMYTDLLNEHARRSGVTHDLQLLILSWVTHASRPLRLLEISDMINITEASGLKRSLKELKALVRAACGPLLEILPDETVCVIHHSLTEFLNGSTREVGTLPTGEGYPILSMAPTHARLSLACITYLCSGCLDTIKITYPERTMVTNRNVRLLTDDERAQQTDIGALMLQHPFLRYALDNWAVHARKAESAGNLSLNLLDGLDNLLSGNVFEALLSISGGVAGITPLHIAAMHGLAAYAETLLRRPHIDVNAADGDGITPILFAADEGYVEVVKVLLANHANPDAPSSYDGLKPLHVAAKNDHAAVVRLLLAAGVDPMTPKTRETPGRRCGNAPSSVGHTALMYATCFGHGEAAKAFVPYLKDDSTVSRALCWAAEYGQTDVVEALLQHPLADVNKKARGNTPLFLACKRFHPSTIIALLKGGADPGIFSFGGSDEFATRINRQWRDSWAAHSDDDNFTALSALCGAELPRINGQQHHMDTVSNVEEIREIIELMIKAGADIEARRSGGTTPLGYAASWSPILVRLLLEAGADANAEQSGGGNALHEASIEEVVQLLAEEGKANTNLVRRSDGKTPLHCTMEKGSPSLVTRYVELGADVNKADNDGNTPLHLVLRGFRLYNIRSQSSILNILDTLLGAGAVLDIRNHKGETPLHQVCADQAEISSIIIEKLVTAAADVNACDNEGGTLLFNFFKTACSSGSTQPNTVSNAMKLIELGASLDVIDNRGRNVLWHCIPRMNVTMLKSIVELGANPKAIDKEGSTLYHGAALKNQYSSGDQSKLFLDTLAELGVDPRQKNCDGISALHIASASADEIQTSAVLDCLIKMFGDVDVKDNYGIRPLHVAAVSSEAAVHQLLEAGANPIEPTNEGITPLHVAARCRQSNTVGLLLEAIEKAAAGDKTAVATHLNVIQRRDFPTALHYACKSGQRETVALLLAAGADPNLECGVPPKPFGWCTLYREEARLWPERPSNEWSFSKPKEIRDTTACIKASDDRRPSRYDVSNLWLEEIMHLLLDHGAEVTAKELLGYSKLNFCDDYLIKCLLNIERRLETEGTSRVSDTQTTTSAMVGRRQKAPQSSWEEPWVFGGAFVDEELVFNNAAVKSRAASTLAAFIETRPWETKYGAGGLLTRLVDNHNYECIEHMFTADDGVDFFGNKQRGLAVKLIDCGLDRVIENATSHRMAQAVRETLREAGSEHREGHEEKQEEKDGDSRGKEQAEPPISVLDAVRRRQSNMVVLRTLVESLMLNINQPGVGNRGSALHLVASGHYWWHVAEAIPYLIKRGANTEAKDDTGSTPLLSALGTRQARGYLHKRAARTLVELGADVNAADDHGETCLAKASNDIELMGLLISHGANVTPSALFAAISSRKLSVIEVLLSNSADPNMRRAKVTGGVGDGDCWSVDEVAHEELYALQEAAWKQDNHLLNTPEYRGAFVPVVAMLLRYGADPFASFQRRSKNGVYELNTGARLGECRILHDLLERGGILQPFLELPNLNLERRDAKGRTLLLAACRTMYGADASIDAMRVSDTAGIYFCEREALNDKLRATGQPSFVEWFLAHGADIQARDNDGRNALHHILGTNPDGGLRAVSLLLQRAPCLVNQVDANGNGPLHVALQCLVRGGSGCDAVELLLDAGAHADIVDADGNSPLHLLGMWLAERSHISAKNDDVPRALFKRMLALGVPINGRNAAGATPAFAFVSGLASMTGEYASTPGDNQDEREYAAWRILTDAGADLQARNAGGETLLHAAAAGIGNGEELAITRFKWLVEQAGLDPMMEDAMQRTALDVAAAKGNTELLRLFERRA